jgi:hypothetical protein
MLKPGKYRRAFDWRVSTSERNTLRTVGKVFAGLSASEYKEMFEDYLEISRKRCGNLTWMAKLQLHLIDEVRLSTKQQSSTTRSSETNYPGSWARSVPVRQN